MYGAYFIFETYVRIILVLLAYMYRVTSNKSRVPNNGRVFIISRLTMQMSRVVEDCHRMWRQKPEKPVCRRYRDWTAVQQVGWWKSTGISVEWHVSDTGEVWRQIRWCIAVHSSVGCYGDLEHDHDAHIRSFTVTRADRTMPFPHSIIAAVSESVLACLHRLAGLWPACHRLPHRVIRTHYRPAYSSITHPPAFPGCTGAPSSIDNGRFRTSVGCWCTLHAAAVRCSNFDDCSGKITEDCEMSIETAGGRENAEQKPENIIQREAKEQTRLVTKYQYRYYYSLLRPTHPPTHNGTWL